MMSSLTRRAFAGALISVPAFRIASGAPANAEQALAELEKKNGGRLGLAALDTGSGSRIAYRGDERFPMASTFKYIAAALVLARADRGEEQLDRKIAVRRSDILVWSPVTEKRVGTSITMSELARAAVAYSDNAAGNLLLASFGGVEGFASFVRSLGDEITRLDGGEPVVNKATPGDPRNTTTPAAMLETMNRIVLGDVLKPESRKLLQDWLLANTTGDARIRAGVPSGWRVGDKTGTGKNGVTNDVAVIWPPDRAPVVLTVYYAESKISQPARNTVVADATRIALAAL
jgi:beta-lactamase class A